jgi:hypothetical protein
VECTDAVVASVHPPGLVTSRPKFSTVQWSWRLFLRPKLSWMSEAKALKQDIYIYMGFHKWRYLKMDDL